MNEKQLENPKGSIVIDVLPEESQPTPAEESVHASGLAANVSADDETRHRFSTKQAFDNQAFDNSELPVKIWQSNSHTLPITYTNEVSCDDALRSKIQDWYSRHRSTIIIIIKVLLFALYNVFLTFAIDKTWNKSDSYCDGVKFLTVVTGIVYFLIVYYTLWIPFAFTPLSKKLEPTFEPVKKLLVHRYLKWVVWGAIIGSTILFLIFDTKNDRYRLVSVGGLLLLVSLGYLFSMHREHIIWNQVLWGIMLQFLFGLVIIRWHIGREMFACFGKKINTFLDYTNYGSGFVFGYLVTGKLEGGAPVQIGIFAFKVLSVILFFSFCTSILYYYGIIQKLVMKVGWILHMTMGTTACESMNASANIFLGMTEAPLLIKPYLPIMTKSEIHAVMTGGFATIAGSVLAAYIEFGANASHLLSASVMSAPAALAYSKLFYPETEISRTHIKDIKIEKGKEQNALEAAVNGASGAIVLIANIAANLIAFLAFIRFLDATFIWFGSLVGWDFISFEWLLSKLFVPLSVIMGVEWKDSEDVARLIGLKTVVNEFVAYKSLADLIKEGKLTERSRNIATYALCGFSNIGSIGIQIGTLSALAPDRVADIAKVAVRAMIAGSAACFMTACIAATLM